MLLAGRTAVITGPAKGMGAAITLALAEAGADLFLLGRDLAAIAPVSDAARSVGRGVTVAACNVLDAADVMRAFNSLPDRIDILVNVAGGTGPLGKPFWENTPEEFEHILALNVTGCFLTMRAVMPRMIAQNYGKIINIGGTFGLRGRAGRAAYSASKWGLRGLTKSAALEAGPHNININTVCPGMVEGPRFDGVSAEIARRRGISIDEAKHGMAAEYALGRISTDHDIAASVVFLASDLSRQITGQDLAVDGGWVI
jgi:3-oxoacyl-[acyl-carrier protein] reductase